MIQPRSPPCLRYVLMLRKSHFVVVVVVAFLLH